jgi:hypothetical protein
MRRNLQAAGVGQDTGEAQALALALLSARETE